MSAHIFTFAHIAAAVLYVALYLCFMFTAAALPMILLTLQERLRRKRMAATLIKRLSANFDISAEDMQSLAQANGVWPRNVRLVVQMALSDTTDPDLFTKLKALISQIDKIQPFNDLPVEVRPSLQHFVALCEQSSEGQTQLWLSPIQRALGAYEDLKLNVARTRRWTIAVNCLGAIGVVVGIAGFYQSLSAPSLADISKEINRHDQAVIQAVEKTLQQQKADQ
jgi:hypothetical protein